MSIDWNEYYKSQANSSVDFIQEIVEVDKHKEFIAEVEQKCDKCGMPLGTRCESSTPCPYYGIENVMG